MADQSSENLRNEVNQLRSDLQSLTRTVREMASQRSEEAYERLRETVGSARERAARAEKAVEHQIEERPLTSVLVVFVGGLIAGLLIGSRR